MLSEKVFKKSLFITISLTINKNCIAIIDSPITPAVNTQEEATRSVKFGVTHLHKPITDNEYNPVYSEFDYSTDTLHIDATLDEDMARILPAPRRFRLILPDNCRLITLPF